MTSERLNEILDEQKIVRYRQHFLKAMKHAVNEALEEAAEKAEAWVDDNGEWTSLRVEARISKQSILNLKVK